MPGPPPKPTAALRLAGSWRANTRKGEPVLPTRAPKPPAWLDGPALDAWNELVEAIGPMRVLTPADGIALGAMADVYAQWKDARAQIQRYGTVLPVKDDAGRTVGLKRSPYVAMHIEYLAALQRLMQQFGLTPSARARLTEDHDKDTTDAFFSRKAARLK